MSDITFALAAGLFCLGLIVRGRRQTKLILERMAQLENRLMATQDELKVQLDEMTAQADKIGGETRTLLTRIEDLLVQLANAANVTPELQAAADALKAQLTVVDELVPDAPEPPPPANND